MARKETDRGKIVNLLKTEHFGDPGKPDAGDPVMETMMMLTLDQLVEYDGNPRRAPNAEYDNLKASYIKTGASNTLLVVTKRPGEEFYFPAAGGNTRLRVLRELWDEFRDEKYYRINCKFIPYSDDRKILVDHLKENDNRDGYIFIDRAKTIIGIKEGMDAELEAPLSQRGFVEQLRDMGYSKLSKTQLIRFQYAVELYEHIPLALDAGMKELAIRQLRETQTSLREFLSAATHGDPAVMKAYDNHWDLELQELDSANGIDLEVLASRLFSAIASRAAERVPDLDNLQIVNRLEHLWKEWQADRESISVSLHTGTASRRATTNPTRAGPAYRYSPEETEDYARESRHSVPGTSVGNSQPGPPRDPHEQDDPPADDRLTDRAGMTLPDQDRVPPAPGSHRSSIDSEAAQEPDYEFLCGYTHRIARELAADFGIGDLVHSCGPAGHGFWIDLPDARLVGKAVTAWTLLWDISGLGQDLDSLALVPSIEFFNGSRLSMQIGRLASGPGMDEFQKLLPPRDDQMKFLRSLPHGQFQAFWMLIENTRRISELLSSLPRPEKRP